MQKNKGSLPIRTFEEIEGIMQAEEEMGNTVQRKMADTYKKLRIQNKRNSQFNSQF